MRIEKLRLRNLNSLAGEWTVDFTHPDYATDGLFAVTGPTGAGKSTILDAVSLGLYGRTPRLNKISKNENEIMSVDAGDCLAEVTFATQKGRFRACWSQRRAHKKAGGDLQPPRHELVDADTNAVLETRVRDVLLRVEKVTGMDYERFSRSVLLPQGRFADFLAADPDGRAPLLEQITGTEIYRDISLEVHRRRNAEQNALAALKNELAAFRPMTEEEETAVAAEIAEKTAQRETAAVRLAEEERRLNWLESLSRLREQATETAAKLARKQEEDANFQPERERLALAEKALELAAAHSALALNRAELRREEQAAETCAAALPALPSLRETLRQLEESAPFLEEKTRLLEENFQLASRVHSFAEARGHLRDGAPCPLCGALEHPLAFGNIPEPDEARARLAEARKAQRANAADTAETRGKLVRLEAARERLAELTAAIASRRAPLAAAEAAFAAAARDKGFPDEAAYLAASLPETERARLRVRALALAADLKELATLERDCRARLEAETALNLTADPTEILAARVAQFRADRSRLDQDIGAHAERLRANAAALALRAGRLAELEARQRESARWEKLHALIGSHDGAKFRNFAQGITFEIMLGHANRQLVKLSDRYILVRDPAQPLSLAVVDAYQAGRRRSVRNLSGGETFIVSLALALGLSTMASRNVRVDSLFLDEGFGALDADTLDAALDTLSQLRAEGKLICAISHLAEVKSRIPARLTLTPLPDGSSLLSGPGCGRGGS